MTEQVCMSKENMHMQWSLSLSFSFYDGRDGGDREYVTEKIILCLNVLIEI